MEGVDIYQNNADAQMTKMIVIANMILDSTVNGKYIYNRSYDP